LKEAGVIKENKVYLKNFNNIPVLTKEIIRKEGKNLYSKDHRKRKSYKNTSGGSTGEPVEFLQDKDYDDWNFATKIYYNKILGKDIGEPELKLWGCDTDIIYNGLDLKERLMNFLYNRKFFNCYRFGEKDIKKLLQIHNSFNPSVYWSYMEALVELARYVKNKKPSISGLKYVISTIGPLTEENRKLIEDNLNCPVYNQYGSREVSWIAAEKGGELEVFLWNNFVEIDNVNNDEGELLITCLSNYSMPLIRYKIGDAAVEGNDFYEIENTRSFFSINKVIGRTLGFFKKRDGSLVHSHFFVQQFFFRDWVKRFQIIQKDYDLIECIVEGAKNKKEMREMEKLFEKLIGKCEIKWRFVTEIKPEKNGKYLYTISEVE
jgi:phenylacetate-CoA ligase